MRPGAPTSKSRFRWNLSPFDVVWSIMAPLIALSLRDPALLYFNEDQYFTHAYQYAALTICFSLPIFAIFRLSDGMSRYFSIADLWAIMGAALTIVAASNITLFGINRMENIPRSTPVIYMLVLVGGLVGGRILARFTGMEPTNDAHDEPILQAQLRRIILIGVDRFAAMAIKLTDCQQPRTTQIIAALDNRERLSGRTVNGVKIVGRSNDVEAVVDEYAVHGIHVDEVWISDNSLSDKDVAHVTGICHAIGIKACALSFALNLRPQQAPIIRETERANLPPHVGYFRFKRALDVFAASLLIVVLAPIFLIAAAVTFFDVGAPVIFWQRRIGRGGQEFFLFKFRTYQAPYGKTGNPVPNDERLSHTGRLIRATRLDEIPQIFNILRGDMSLIGPRPLLPIDQPEDPRHRLLVRPGGTGWAQGVGGTTVDPEEKEALDVWYIHHASPMIDVTIVWRTLMVVFRGESLDRQGIEAAVNWRAKLRAIDQYLFHDSDKLKTFKPKPESGGNDFEEKDTPKPSSRSAG